MSEGETTSTAGGPAGDSDLAARLDAQESKLDRLAEMVSRIIPGSHAEAQQHTAARLDRPSRAADAAADIGAQVRAELDRRDAQAAERTERETLKAQVAKLAETPPKPPVRRATKLLGWGSE